MKNNKIFVIIIIAICINIPAITATNNAYTCAGPLVLAAADVLNGVKVAGQKTIYS